MMLVKGDVVEAGFVEDRARVGIAEDGGVAFDKGVEALFSNQVGRDALDLIRRTAVKGRKGDGAADMRRDAVDQPGVLGEVFF